MFFSRKIDDKYFNKVIEVYGDGKKYITIITLGKATGVDTYHYHEAYHPNLDLLSGFAAGQLIGGAIGQIIQGQAIIGQVLGAWNRAGIATKFESGYVTIPADVDEEISILKEMAKDSTINKNEFVKAVASLAFNDGDCEIDIDKDAFGDYVFKNEQEEMIAAMKVQFFYENTTSADKVRNLVLQYKQKQ